MIFGEGPIIKNIAGDLNKLFLQGTRAGQSINNVEGDAAADQGTVDLLATMDPVIHEVAVGMSGEQEARYSVSGVPPLSLPNSIGKQLAAWSVDLLPYQEGTGDPSPENARPIHGTDKINIVTAGKNLLDTSNLTEWSNYRGLTIIRNADGSFELDGTCTETAYQVISLPLKAGTYCVSGCPSGGSANTYSIFIGNPINKYDFGNGETFTVAQDTTVSVVLPRVISGAVCDHLLFKPQICLASAPNPTEFVPYATPSNAVITLPQTVYTATIGSEGGESRYAEVDMGSLIWNYDATYNRFNSISLSNVIVTATAVRTQLLYCEQFNVITDNRPLTQVPDMSIYTGFESGSTRVYVHDSDYTTASAFTSAVTGVKLVYPLATPVQFAVPSVTIPTPTGTATAWATAEDGIVDSMEVTYVGKA